MRPNVILRNETTKDFIDMTKGLECRLTSLEGIGEPDATVSTSVLANYDGSYVGAAYIEKRNIVMGFSFIPQYIERHRLRMYDVIQTRKPIRVYYRTKNVNVYSDGIVESFTVDNFKESTTTGQISIICSDPFWYSNATHIAKQDSVVDMFYFPFAIDEAGVPLSAYRKGSVVTITNKSVETGAIFVLTFSGSAVNPYIHDDVTGESLEIVGNYEDGDVITIDTRQMHKSIMLKRGSTADERSLIASMTTTSTWLQLHKGENSFTIDANDNISGGDNMSVEIRWQDRYLGV